MCTHISLTAEHLALDIFFYFFVKPGPGSLEHAKRPAENMHAGAHSTHISAREKELPLHFYFLLPACKYQPWGHCSNCDWRISFHKLYLLHEVCQIVALDFIDEAVTNCIHLRNSKYKSQGGHASASTFSIAPGAFLQSRVIICCQHMQVLNVSLHFNEEW